MNLNSTALKVFPSSLRNDEFDRDARLNTEYNITNLINRLTARDAFIISGFDKVESNSLNGGQLNVLGYYFNVEQAIDLSSFNPGNNSILFFKITLKPMTATDQSIKFLQLDGRDTSTGTNSKYTGLSIDIDNGSSDIVTTDANGIITCRIPIMVYTTASATPWQIIKSSRLIYDLFQIKVNDKDFIDSGLTMYTDTNKDSLHNLND